MPVQVASRQEVQEFGSNIQQLPEAGMSLLHNGFLAAVAFRDLSDAHAQLSDLIVDGPGYGDGPSWERVVESLPVHALADAAAKFWAKDPAKPQQLRPTFGTVAVRELGIGPHNDYPREAPLAFSFRIDDNFDTERTFYIRRYPGYPTYDKNGDETKYYTWVHNKASLRSLTKDYVGLTRIIQKPGDLILFDPHSIHAAQITSQPEENPKGTKIIIGSLRLETVDLPQNPLWRRITRQLIKV